MHILHQDIESISAEHPAWAQLVDLGISDIETRLRHQPSVIYCLEMFSALAVSFMNDRYQMPVYQLFGAYRASMKRFCPMPVIAPCPMAATVTWAESHGLLGLIGLFPVASGSTTKLYLTDVSALVLAHLEFRQSD